MEQTFSLLTTLGYSDGDRVYIRCLAGKGYDIKESGLYPVKGYLTVGSWEFTCYKSEDGNDIQKWKSKDGLATLKRLNDKGYGVYFVPNHGGDKDAKIDKFPALFYECDDISKDEQKERVNRLSVKPSAIIDTRNSLHVYYCASDITEWRETQQRLIQLMDSDPSIHNESRLMRLPGFDHHQKGAEPYPVTVTDINPNIYQFSEIDSLLPQWDGSKWTKTIEEDRETIQKRLEYLSTVREIVGDEAFPLEVCLTKSDRDLIRYGVEKGRGYTEGFKLACNLIATDNWLRGAGFRFDGSAEELFQYFAAQSGQSYRSQNDIDKVFNNAKRMNPSPSLSPEAMENCINAWRYKNSSNPAQKQALTRTRITKGIINHIENGVIGLLDSVHNLVKKGFIGFSPKVISDKSPSQVGLVPASEYDGHIVEFNPGEGAQIYEKAGRLGYRYILDQSPTGAGKTHTVSQLNPNHFFVNPDDSETTEFRQLIYCSQSHRNPNNAGIEHDFYEMVSRTTGYELDYDKLTPLNRPYRVKATEDTPEELRTKSNCHWSDLFNQAYSAGHSTEGFCGSCQYFDKCRVTNGEGFGYLSESNQFKKESRVHGHLKGIPVGAVDDNVILIIDEAETAEWVEIQTVAEKDVKAVFKAIKAYSESLYKLLLPLKDGLVDLYDEDSNPSPAYGWHYEDINLELPEGVLDLIPEIQQVEASLRPDAKELAEGKKPMYQAFLVNLIHILAGKKRGSLSASNKSLTIHSINQRNLDHVTGAHCTIFQDATMSRFQLAKIQGIEEKDILLIRQKVPQKHNLVINQYVGVGRLGNNRSQDEVNRAELWREYFAGRDMGWIDYKAHSQEGDLIHGGDGRGSNAFQKKKEVGIMGVYRPNMGAVLSETEAILGKKLSFDSEEFKQFYGHKIASNVLQEVGRLRNNRRNEDKLTVHLIGDGDLSFLDEMGLNLQVIDATTIGLEYATIENRTKQRNLNICVAYVKELGESALEALRQNSLADMLGITPQALCQWGKKLFAMEGDAPGEWFKRFKAAVMALIKPEPKEVEGERLEIIECLVNDIFPVVARFTCTANEFMTAFTDCLGAFSWEDILEALNRLSLNISGRILFRILRFAG